MYSFKNLATNVNQKQNGKFSLILVDFFSHVWLYRYVILVNPYFKNLLNNGKELLQNHQKGSPQKVNFF